MARSRYDYRAVHDEAYTYNLLGRPWWSLYL